MDYTDPQLIAASPRIRTSGVCSQLSEALARAQGNFGAAIKNADNPHLKSKYADITAVIEATLQYLNAEGIVVTQHPSLGFHGDKPFVTVTTRLQLKDQWQESDLNVPATLMNKFDPQTVGAAITYGCRYALQAILVVPRADAESEPEEAKPTKTKSTVMGPPKANIPPSPFSGQTPPVGVPFNGQDLDGYNNQTRVPALNPHEAMRTALNGGPLTGARMPTKEEMAGFLKRSRLYSRDILPKHFEDGPGTLKSYIEKKTGVLDVKNLTFQQWTGLLDDLDDNERSGHLKEYIVEPLFAKQSA